MSPVPRKYICTRVAGVVPEDDGNLLQGHVVVGGKPAAAVTTHDAALGPPGDGVVEPVAGGNVVELVLAGGGGLPLFVVQNLNHHGAVQSVVRTELVGAVAAHELVGYHVIHGVGVPGVAIHIGKTGGDSGWRHGNN